MKRFAFTAIDKQGDLFCGECDAENTRQVKETIRSWGYVDPYVTVHPESATWIDYLTLSAESSVLKWFKKVIESVLCTILVKWYTRDLKQKAGDSVPRLVDLILKEAMKHNATEIVFYLGLRIERLPLPTGDHIDREVIDKLLLEFQIDGRSHEVESPPRMIAQSVVDCLMERAGAGDKEGDQAPLGEFDVTNEYGRATARLSISTESFGKKLRLTLDYYQ